MRSKFLLMLIPLSILLTLFAKYNLNFAEFYALNIYPFFLKTWGALSFKTYNSLAELIIVAVFLLIFFLTVYTILITAKYKTFKYIKKYALNLLLFFSVTLFLFVLFCGINYHRYEFTKYSGLEIKKSSKEELIGLCELLIEDANKTR